MNEEYLDSRFSEVLSEIREHRVERKKFEERIDKFLFRGNGNEPVDVRLHLLESWRGGIAKLFWIILPIAGTVIGGLVVHAFI